MKIIELTKGKIALVDDEGFDQLNRYKWHAQKARNTFYACRRVVKNGRSLHDVYTHREILDVNDPKFACVDR